MAAESPETIPQGRIASQWQRIEFFLREVSADIRLNPLMSLAAVSTATFALVTWGLFYLLLINLNDLIQREARKVGVQAYLPLNWQENQRDDLDRRLRGLPGVVSVEYISSEEALRRLKGQLGEEGFLEDLGPSRIPAGFALQVLNPEQVAPLAATLSAWPEFEDVRYSRRLTSRLLHVVNLVKAGGLGLLTLLGMVACIFIHNTIRLTILARQREIRIMQLVGATNAFIRVPFLLEGLLHGLAGAALAALLLTGLYRWGLGWAESAPFVQLVQQPSLWWQLTALVFAIGMLFGGLGSWISLRTCLREDLG